MQRKRSNNHFEPALTMHNLIDKNNWLIINERKYIDRSID